MIDLTKDGKLVYHCGMTPQKLPVCVVSDYMFILCMLCLDGLTILFFQDLVEHNPHIAVEVLSKLINSSDMDAYV